MFNSYKLLQPGNPLVVKADNYFSFNNPGDMRVKAEEAFQDGTSEARNPILHTMFSYLGYGERTDSGLSLIKRTWAEKGWPEPSFRETKNPDKTLLNETQLKILKIMRDNP